jgi:hypothetical protein
MGQAVEPHPRVTRGTVTRHVGCIAMHLMVQLMTMRIVQVYLSNIGSVDECS